MESYWVSSFFFPQGFMTSAMQSYARKTMISIDSLMFRAEVRNFTKEDIRDVPTEGVNIHGLFLEGCKISPDACLTDSDRKILFVEMPVIWLQPVQIEKYKPKEMFYQCPLYKTSTRRGTLSTTGHSTNFVMYMDLKTKVNPDIWVRAGVAMLCQLDE